MTNEQIFKVIDKDGVDVTALFSTEATEQTEVGIERGTSRPTSVKTLNGTQSYQSQGFSGSGTRYSGYIFNTTDYPNKFRFNFTKGGFACLLINNPKDPATVAYTVNLPLDRSPYTFENGEGYHFYFGVDNPKSGQTYKVTKLKS